MTPLQEIKIALEMGVISYNDAFEKIKKLPKPWHTTEWKKRRSKLLKEKCEQCGVENTTLVIQHFSHPPKFKDIRNSIFQEKFESFTQESKIDFKELSVSESEYQDFINNQIEIRDACPKCSKQAAHKRKTVRPLYRCSSCHFEFDVPASIEYIPSLRTRPENVDIKQYLLDEKVKLKTYELKSLKFREWEEEISRMALLISIDFSIQYSSMTDTATFCKRCASKMDRFDLLLCYSCRENYFDFRLYETCYTCWSTGKTSTINPFKKRVNEHL